MVEIEEIDDDDGLELEENPGECELELEENLGQCVLEDDDGCLLEDNGKGQEATGGGLPVLETNALASDLDDDDDDDDDEWEIPYASEGQPALPTSQTLDIRLMRQGSERLGLVLDANNEVVALREDTPAARSGEVFTGDVVLAVQGVACSPERRVAQLLRTLPDAATYVFTVRRALDASMVNTFAAPLAEHGPLLTPEENAAQQQKELEMRHELYAPEGLDPRGSQPWTPEGPSPAPVLQKASNPSRPPPAA